MRDWFRLLRAAGLITILANALTAATCALYGGSAIDPAWLAQRLLAGGWAVPMVLAASACLYLSGMLWNDIVDVERDRVLHPERPLPSGRIGLLPACLVGAALAAAGPVLAFAAHRWLGLSLACLVLVLSFLYNLGTKHLPGLGALTMAAVRAAHAAFAILLVGPDLLRIALTASDGAPRFPAYAALLGLWVLGVAWISELESRPSWRWELLAAGGVLILALAWAVQMAVTAPWVGRMWQEGGAGPIAAGTAVALVAALALGAGIVACGPWLAAVRHGSREAVGRAVGAGLGAMILLDAAVAAAHQPLVGIAVALLYPVFRLLSAIGRMD